MSFDWKAFWASGETGAFHKPEVHPLLIKYWHEVNVAKKHTVFIPLCGKSHDIYWLSQYVDSVYGCELSPIPIEAFFQSYDIHYSKTVINPTLSLYQGQNISIYCGDFFALTSEHLPSIDVIYDRAALIALPPVKRKDYIEQLLRFLSPAGHILLLTMNFSGKTDDLSPYPIESEQVERLFSNSHVNCWHDKTHQLSPEEPLYERGIQQVCHNVFDIYRSMMN